MESKKLIVGVDYGTTYSGVSWVWASATGIEDINLITDWGTAERTVGKAGFERLVPSRIAYSPDISWGYAIEPDATVYCWSKLLLDRHAQPSHFDDPSLRDVDGPGLLITPPGKTPEDVVTDFLSQLYQHVMEHLAQKINDSILDVTPIEFWFTIPALWGIRAENSTRDAALKAGFGSRPEDVIHLIREPEAAVICCLNEMTKDGANELVKPGDGVLVCDCGGGTVDLTSYTVQVAYPKPNLSQACVGEGGKCGSTTIDRALHKLMTSRFGSAFTDLPYEMKSGNSSFMLQFESAKRDFGVSKVASRKYRFALNLGISQSEWYDAKRAEVIITTDDMTSLFDPVVQQIIGLLEQQISASKSESNLTIKTLCIVGGFGESVYLFNKLMEWCPSGLELINPTKSWEAICIGAALRGLDGPTVTKKKCRRHIGTTVSKPFREGIDNADDAYEDLFDNEKKTGGHMDWMVNRGETITPETVVIRSYTLSFPATKEKKWQESLYESTMAVAPEKEDHHSVKKTGELQVDLTNVPLDQFEYKDLSSPFLWKKVRLYRIVFQMAMVVEDDLGYMYFRAVCDGKQVGETRLQFGQEEL